MAPLSLALENKQEVEEMCTRDGTVDFHGRPALTNKTGTWAAGIILLINQGLATLAFFGVAVNLVLFLTRVLLQDNAQAANNVSKWTGTVYLFSLVGAFLSDSYWGRYKTCVIFQGIFVIGLVGLSISTHSFLLSPKGCGNQNTNCGSHSSLEIGLFYLFTYMIALGNGGYQPNVATFGADQFDKENAKEANSKVTFFSFFYLAMNLGSLFSNTVLDYFEDKGLWTLGFWASTGSAFAALVLFLAGTSKYRHFKPGGNPFSRFCQVIIASAKKWRVQLTPGEYTLYEADGENESSLGGTRRIFRTHGFKFLDKAAVVTSWDFKTGVHNPWRLCPISQVEEVKCIIRLLPIWLCTIIYSVVFTQMASLFVEQGAAMKSKFSGFQIPPASMSGFDILSVAAFILLYRQVISPLASKTIGTKSKGLTELQRMGIGLVIAIMAMISAGLVEYFRLKYAKNCRECENSSSLSIFWQIPQYAFIGASEVFMYVGQLEFFNAETPAGLKSFGSALCMTSMAFGNYVSSLIVTIVMKTSTSDHMAGWIPENLNHGHLDRFYFLLATLTGLDLIAYIFCAKWYNNVKQEGKSGQDNEKSNIQG